MGLQNHLSSDISANLLVASIAEELTTTIKGIGIDKTDRNKLLNNMLEINKILEENKSQEKFFSFKSQLKEIQDILNEPIHKSWMEKILFKTQNLISYMMGSGKEETAEQEMKDDKDIIRQCFNEWNKTITSPPDYVKENQPVPQDSLKVIHDVPDQHWENNNSFVSESEVLIVNYSRIRHEKSRDNVSELTESHKSNQYDIGSFEQNTDSYRPIYSLETDTKTEQTDLSYLDQELREALFEKICETEAMKERNRSKRPKGRVCTRRGGRDKANNEETTKRAKSPAKETPKRNNSSAKLEEDSRDDKRGNIDEYEKLKDFYESKRTDLPETNDKNETCRELQESIEAREHQEKIEIQETIEIQERMEIANEHDCADSSNPVPKVEEVEPKREKTKEKRERKCNVSRNRHKTNVKPEEKANVKPVDKTNVKPEDSTPATVYSVLSESKKFNTRKKLNRLGNCGISSNDKSTEEECQCGLKTGVASMDMTSDKNLRDKAALLPTPAAPDSSGSMFRYLGEMCYQKLLPGAAFSPSQVKNMLTMCEDKKPEVKDQLSRTRVILKDQVEKRENIGDRKSTRRRKRSQRDKQIDPAVVEDLKSRCASIRKQLESIESKADLLKTKNRLRKRVGNSESGDEAEDFRRKRGQRRITPPESVQGSNLCNIM